MADFGNYNFTYLYNGQSFPVDMSRTSTTLTTNFGNTGAFTAADQTALTTGLLKPHVETNPARLLGQGQRRINAFRIGNGDYYIMENGRVIEKPYNAAEFKQAISKYKNEGAKILTEAPHGETVGRRELIAPKVETNPARLLEQGTPAQTQKAATSSIFPSADGNEYGRMLRENGVTPKKPLTPEAQTALDNARRAEAGAKFQGTTAEAIDAQLGIGKESDLSKYYRQQELSSAALENARRAEAGGKFKGVTAEEIDRRLGIGVESDNTKFYRELEAQQNAQKALDAAKKAEQAAGASDAYKGLDIGVNKNPITDAAKYEADLAKACDDKFGKLAEETGKTGFFSKVGGWIKKNPIKTGLIVAGAIGVGYLLYKGISSLFKKDDNKVEETPAQEQVPEEETTPVVPEEEVPVEEVPEEVVVPPVVPEEEVPVEDEVPVEEETPVEEVPTENETPATGITKALKGSDYWKYAERELIMEHRNEPGYRPSNKDINTRMLELMIRNNVEFAEDGIHSNPMLMVGDDVHVSQELTEILNQATQALIEEHKDEQGYQPTYKEVAKKMDEILASQQ